MYRVGDIRKTVRLRDEKKTYATVSAVCAPPLLWGLVDLDVLYDQVSGVETFGVGIGFGVFEEAEEEFGRLLWPASF